jgi:dimethylhistidine N-methyltransferase
LELPSAHDAGRAAADRLEFLRDVLEGLSRLPKSIPSRHFYDAEGSRIFEEIMRMPGYYPTRRETEILTRYGRDILDGMGGVPFHLVDLGAGDAAKTRILLERFHRSGSLLSYLPVDISGDALERMSGGLRRDLAGLEVHPLAEDYSGALDRLRAAGIGPKLVLFLGSTIGNFDRREAVGFMKGVRASLAPGDGFLAGFDLRKEPRTILRAYDDETGVTARFNLNLLARINRELEADFEPRAFLHHAAYDPADGVARSYLVSRKGQAVRIRMAGVTVRFDPWESIHTEDSFKYSPGEILALAKASGFAEIARYRDSEESFQDSLWTPSS